jgi:hypothetical protein
MSPKKFILTTLFTLIFYNLSRLIGWNYFSETDWWKSIISDGLHHYQLGILLVFSALLFLKKSLFIRDLLLAIGTGMIIDESMYILYPINNAFSHYSPIGIALELIVFIVFALIIFRAKKPLNRF